MKNCLRYSTNYAKEMNLFDFGLLKLCLCAAGVLLGIAIPSKHKKKAALAAAAVYSLTYVPLMVKYFAFLEKSRLNIAK